MIYYRLLLIPLLLTAFHAAYIDYREKRVPNGSILLLLLLTSAINFLDYSAGAETAVSILLLATKTLFLMFFLYYFGFISAGDAKFFIVLTLALPAFLNINHKLELMLFNTFLPVTGVMVVDSMRKTTMKDALNELKSRITIKSLITNFFKLFALSGPTSLLAQALMLTGLFTRFLRIGLLELIDRLPFKDYFVYIPLLLYTLFIFTSKPLFFLASTIQSFMLYVTLKYIVFALGSSSLIQNVDFKDLQVGDMPAEKIYERDGTYYKKETSVLSLFSPLRQRDDYDYLLNDDKLRQKDLDNLEEIEANSGHEKLKIYDTFALGPAILLGYILTFLLRSDFINYLVRLLGL